MTIDARFLAENLMSKVQFPDHTVAAEEEPTGNEAWRVATGRRSGIKYATATTANSEWWIGVTFDRLRAFDMIVIDRGHNLAGYAMDFRISSDSFSTYETVFDITMPAVSSPGSLSNGLGVLTEEGAWVKSFDVRASLEARLYIDAMGAGLKPQIPGLYFGKSISVPYLDKPWSEDMDTMFVSEATLESGWTGRGPITQRRGGTITLKASSFDNYDDELRYHFQGRFGSGAPMWIALDEDQGDRPRIAWQEHEAL
jgi:hypothetical protein